MSRPANAPKAKRPDDALGRGPLTRWMPVFGQAADTPPEVVPFPVNTATTPAQFQRTVLFSAKRLTFPAAMLAILWQVAEALVPVIAGAAIDQALVSGDFGTLVWWLVVLGVVFAVLSMAYRFAAQLTELATEQAQHRLRATLSQRVLHPDWGAGPRPDGTVVSVMTNDTARIAAMGLVVFPLGELTGVVFIAVSLLLIHPLLGVVALVGAPVVVWLMGALSGSYARASREYQNLLAETVGRATDLVAGYRVIRGIRAEDEATRRYRDASRKSLDGAYRSAGVLGRFLAGSETISGVFIAGIAALAGWFAITGQLSIGGLIAAVGLTQALLPPIRMLSGNAVPLWAAAVASSARLLELYRPALLRSVTGANSESGTDSEPGTGPESGAVETPRNAEPAPAVTGVPAIEFSLTSPAVPVLRAVQVAPGEFLGVRADDRTAAAVVAAFLQPGRDPNVNVALNGSPAELLDPASYRAHVIVAPHQPALFTGTIAENVTTPTGHPGLWEAALHAAACEDFLHAAGGLTGQVGEGGNRLSGGQRQRLALARALASDAPVLVLHDPTTAVDSVTEARIAHRLGRIRAGRSTLLVTSSRTLLSTCDRVIDLHPDGAAP